MSAPVDALAGHVSLSWLRAEANMLRSDAGENSEYDRALEELLSGACPDPAVAELVEAVRWLQRLRAIGSSPRMEEASERVDAALAKFGPAP